MRKQRRKELNGTTHVKMFFFHRGTRGKRMGAWGKGDKLNTVHMVRETTETTLYVEMVIQQRGNKQ